MSYKYKYLKYKKKYLDLKNYAIGGGENIKELKDSLKNMIINKLKLYKFKYDEKDIVDEITFQYNILENKIKKYWENFDPQARARPNYILLNTNEKILYLFDKIIVKYKYNYIENLKFKNIENIKIGLNRLSTEREKKLIIKENYMTLFYIFKMNDLNESYNDIFSLVIENVNDFIVSKINLNSKKLENLSGGGFGFLGKIKDTYKDHKRRKEKFKSLKEQIKNDTELNYVDKKILQNKIRLGNLEALDLAYFNIKKKYKDEKKKEEMILATENNKIKRFIRYIKEDDKLFENNDLKNGAIKSLGDPDNLLRIYILSVYNVKDLGKILEKAKKANHLKKYFVSEYRFMVEETIKQIKMNYNYNKNNIIEDLLEFKDIDIEKYNLYILIFLYENYKEEIFLRFENKQVLERLGIFLSKLKNTVNKDYK